MNPEATSAIGSFIINLAGFEIPGDILFYEANADLGTPAFIEIRVSETPAMAESAMKYLGITSTDDLTVNLSVIEEGDEGGPAVSILFLSNNQE